MKAWENLDDILCEQDERTVSGDNCVSFEGMKLQIPANRYRCHYVKVRVRIHRYIDGSLAIFHGQRNLADYDQQGKLREIKKAAWWSYPQPSPPCFPKAAGECLWITPIRKMIEESVRPPLTSCSQNRIHLMNSKSGQFMCYKTGQFSVNPLLIWFLVKIMIEKPR